MFCLMFLLMIQERSHLFYKWLYEEYLGHPHLLWVTDTPRHLICISDLIPSPWIGDESTRFQHQAVIIEANGPTFFV